MWSDVWRSPGRAAHTIGWDIRVVLSLSLCPSFYDLSPGSEVTEGLGTTEADRPKHGVRWLCRLCSLLRTETKYGAEKVGNKQSLLLNTVTKQSTKWFYVLALPSGFYWKRLEIEI